MGLHPRKKARFRPGPQEAVALAALALVGITAVLWLNAWNEPSWQETKADAYSCALRRLAYSRDSLPDQVELHYEYSVGGHAYQGRWDGFWPQGQSPNALRREDLPQLKNGTFPLKVFYDPAHPEINRIHHARNLRPVARSRLFAAAMLLAAIYWLKLYPAWKLHAKKSA